MTCYSSRLINRRCEWTLRLLTFKRNELKDEIEHDVVNDPDKRDDRLTVA